MMSGKDFTIDNEHPYCYELEGKSVCHNWDQVKKIDVILPGMSWPNIRAWIIGTCFRYNTCPPDIEKKIQKMETSLHIN